MAGIGDRVRKLEDWVRSCEGMDAAWVKPLAQQAKRVDCLLRQKCKLDDRVEALEGCNSELEAHLATLEKRLVQLEARGEAEDEGLRAEVDSAGNEECLNCGGPLKRVNGWVCENCGDTSVGSAEVEQRKPAVATCAAQGCTNGAGPIGRYCGAHYRLRNLLDAAIAGTRQAIETAEDPFGWETSLQGLLQARRAIVGPEAQPTPVTTVGVKCPSCLGCGVQTAPYKPGQLEVTWASCPYCLGAGIVHTDADYQRVAQELDLYRRALIAACHDIGFGQADVHRFLAEAAQEAEGNE